MGKIKVVGLGPGDIEQLPFGVYQLLKKEKPLYLRTKLHPAVEDLEQEGLVFQSFDTIYEENNQFEGVYETIVQELLEAAKKEDIIYAVPGHPMVAEKSVQLLLENKAGISIEIKGGKSFLDDLFQAVKIDPVEGFQLVDALDLNQDDLVASQHIIVMQVFNEYIASEVKLTLMEKYPDEHILALVHEAGSKNEKVDWLPLFELDRMEGVHNLTSLYVPPLAVDERTKSFQTVQYYIDTIMGEDGDAWIKKQDHRTLLTYLEEEVSEFKAAVEDDDIDNMVEELGDLLMQVLYHTNVGEQSGYFSFEEVVETLNKKLRRRHPHVFDGIKAETAEEVDAIWQKIKAEEKRNNL
ncbi:tetrapyrrole methylase family protein / MazG family protein [Carnobacterium alterfunditum]|uniref:Tetrapyrrole methylase family protein / MazG family protein n=1 Tax=Carnobacterium alterfunditum TaxID=28230 RepID=A0A1N6FEP8_9LACT|nr:MazG nucleotide pyrophosphohydrolase domain-containing protein [Carnobacterium alterfunditum]SIN93720.1 tetrapyrrole methylase family protein / MazG family protein [Carnobacterium alterfunditum]